MIKFSSIACAAAVCMGSFAAMAMTSQAMAKEADSCSVVRFAEVGWTDIQATTGIATTVLEGLGYKTETKTTSVPVTFVALGKGQIDAFLGLWQPSMNSMAKDRLADGSIELLQTNLTGAKYTLAVPKYVYDAGVKNLADLDAHKDKFGGKIYGIEPGNDGNQLIQDMIDKDEFGLKDWQLVESSEAVMLMHAKSSVTAGEWVTFLGWAPHPMNTKMEIKYLSGGDAYFGPNKGAAQVSTLTRKGYASECPNVGKFLKNLKFSVQEENIIMGGIMDHKLSGPKAAKTYLKANPDLLKPWLQGVQTVDGKPGLRAVTDYLSK